jgi:hypothetical protein
MRWRDIPLWIAYPLGYGVVVVGLDRLAGRAGPGTVAGSLPRRPSTLVRVLPNVG